MSLLEVLVALAIFLMSLIVIGRLVSLGGDRALDVQQKGQAAQLCQSKLAEVVAGAVALSSQAEVPFEEDANWYWSLDAEQGTVTGLWDVTVRVTRTRSDGSRIECSMQQMVLDPSLRGSTADAATASSASSTETSGSSTGGASSSGGSTTTPSSATAGASGTAAKTTATPAPTTNSSAPKSSSSATPAPTTNSSAPKSSSSSGASKTGGR